MIVNPVEALVIGLTPAVCGLINLFESELLRDFWS